MNVIILPVMGLKSLKPKFLWPGWYCHQQKYILLNVVGCTAWVHSLRRRAFSDMRVYACTVYAHCRVKWRPAPPLWSSNGVGLVLLLLVVDRVRVWWDILAPSMIRPIRPKFVKVSAILCFRPHPWKHQCTLVCAYVLNLYWSCMELMRRKRIKELSCCFFMSHLKMYALLT